MIAAAVGWTFVGIVVGSLLTTLAMSCVRVGADADRRLADLDDPIPYDVAYARNLELPEAWEQPAVDDHTEGPCDDPVTHARLGCLRCITAIELMRCIAFDDAWDRAFAAIIEGGAA